MVRCCQLTAIGRRDLPGRCQRLGEGLHAFICAALYLREMLRVADAQRLPFCVSLAAVSLKLLTQGGDRLALHLRSALRSSRFCLGGCEFETRS
ncbi:hypothetical protein EB73_21155 [Mycobacterium sp. SWH-M3]|nr:hypothetical protein EB73_21155 [Mycobacterium sp. SWH-M3]